MYSGVFQPVNSRLLTKQNGCLKSHTCHCHGSGDWAQEAGHYGSSKGCKKIHHQIREIKVSVNASHCGGTCHCMHHFTVRDVFLKLPQDLACQTWYMQGFDETAARKSDEVSRNQRVLCGKYSNTVTDGLVRKHIFNGRRQECMLCLL